MKFKLKSFLVVALALLPQLAFAAGMDGAQLSLWWGLPFAALLLSFAIVPMFAPIFWHHHYGKVILFCALAFVMPYFLVFGFPALWGVLIHALLEEYIPFILLLVALFAVSGGIFIDTSVRATPAINTGILALGAVLASLMGTTGASMLLIRPLIRTNAHRQKRAHIVIFFIFIVSNIGGSLTPLGDPPLFLGFIKGVTFFWTLAHLWQETLFLIVVLLVFFYLLDTYFVRKELQGDGFKKAIELDITRLAPRFAMKGKLNFVLLLCVVGLVLMSGIWKPEIYFQLCGIKILLPNVLRDLGLLLIAVISMVITHKGIRQANQFSWVPMVEVAKLFAGIFLTIAPVIAILRAGMEGHFSTIIAAVNDTQGDPIPAMYFWATGLISSFLDNAPTYLVFFNTASGDAQVMMNELAMTLVAVSAGAVFMGANTYIGNAPNLMVKSIAQERDIRMPGFFGYMMWSCGILVPLFALITLIWYL